MADKPARDVDPELVKCLKTYLAKSGPSVLNGDPQAFKSALDEKEADEVLKLFIADPQIGVLIVHRRVESEKDVYRFDLQVKPQDGKGVSIAYIKSVGNFDAKIPMADQLQLCQLNDEKPFQVILAYVRNCFLPYSRSLMASALNDTKKTESDIGAIRNVNGKLSELEVELLRSQQSVEIPLIQLELHKKIAEFVGKGGPLKVASLPDAADTNFLNEVQKGLNDWKKQILQVTTLNRDVDSGTTLQEINFWLGMEKAIMHLYEQRESPGVAFTFEVLNDAKRFLATTGFMPDVGLSDAKAKDKVFKYSNLLRDLPIKPLLSATDFAQMVTALESIFNHLKQIRRIEYPLNRAVKLMHAISRDVVTTMQTNLNSKRPMALIFEEFEKATKPSETLFVVWDTQLEAFNDELKDLRKSRPEDEDPTSLIPLPYVELTALRSRLADLRKIRKEHEELRSVVDETLVHDPVTRDASLRAINDAYQFLREVDVLAISHDGTSLFEAAVNNYKSKIDSVESELEQTIQRMLDAAKDDANEMFRVCRKFNALFVRPRIAGTIRKYQEQLISTVKKDIQQLSDKFKLTYSHSEASPMSDLRDLPPVSGSIIWGRQIERQLETYLSRVEDVLGKQWVHHVEGRQLKRETDQFKEHLQPLKIFQQWLQDNKQIAQFEVEGRIFKMVTVNKQVTLGVNFDQKLVTLFKEVRNLNRLGLRVPYEIKIAADEAREKFPYAMRLDEVIRTYGRTSRVLEENPDLAPLAANYKKKVQDSIQAGLFLQWDSERLKKYVEQLGTETVEYQDQVDELLQYAGKTGDALNRLRNSKPAEKETLKAILHEIQTIIDHLDKRGYSNLADWVGKLNATVEDILVERQKRVLFLWRKALDIELLTEDAQLDIDKAIEEEKARRTKQAERGDVEDDDESRKTLEEKRSAMEFVIKEPVRIRINIRNQVLDMDPPLEHARMLVGKDLQQWLAVVAELPQLKCFWMAEKKEEAGKTKETVTFRSALSRLGTEDLRLCLLGIETKLAAADKYVQTWLQYQALWDMNLDTVTKSLGTDLKVWEKLLVDMKASRATFDNTATEKRFGPFLVDYKSVQTKVNNKYDAWHKDVLNKLGELMNGLIATLYSALQNGRKTLETYNFDFSTTQNILDSVTLLQELNKKSKIWSADLETQKNVEGLLQKQRFVFPQDWIYTDRVQGEWQAFEQILNRKLLKMSKEASTIQAKITQEEQKLEQRVKEAVEAWKKEKPVSGDLEHTEVMRTLDKFDDNVTGLTKELARLNLAKQALEMPVKEETRLQPVKEEVDQMKEVWGVLGGSWAKLEQMGEQLFREAKIKELRKDLNGLQDSVARLPNSMRQYSGYENLRNKIKDYHGLCPSLTELGSGILRPKHQKQILQILNIDASWRDLTINQLWKADIKRHQKQIRFILEQAQGESALEEFLLEVASAWEASKFDLADYRGKCFLVRNWDSLFDQLSNNLGDIQSMKSSPFYPAFEQDALKWESRLNHAQAIFDLFVDVQRRWVYLEGIFNNSQEVQMQLAYQYKKFKTFDADFIKLMREIKREDQCDYWVKEERGLLPKMEGYAEVLDGIQKALAEYLEKQRAQFPRFYFVGDEDLLEIIGNSKNILKIVRHMSKMFAGIEGLVLSEDNNTIKGMISKEGEQVAFKETINIPEAKSIHEWLHKLEFQMRFTLAALLDESLKDAKSYRKGAAELDVPKFFQWVDKYPAQICLLSTLVEWSETIETGLAAAKGPDELLKRILVTLGVLADNILSPDLSSDKRKKYEQLITEFVHQRDVCRQLLEAKVARTDDYKWTEHMRYYYNQKPKVTGKLTGDTGGISSQLLICISRASFYYGWEYLGVAERLVQTPLTDRCYLTMTEALHMRMGGNPYGPAGTGKTESVKALGNQLGRFVLVFNCDENFDLNAMGRIFVGLCQCGAWGCFDEFNRLEERILSAVSQQILTIQSGLREFAKEITLLNKPVALSDNLGIFVTMNPGYAGRSNLPDNLKQLFRGIAMIKPNTVLIGEVMLFSQGFRTAEDLSGKVVMLFSLCDDQLSSQSHYDFGLRALKSVLRSAGNLKRSILMKQRQKKEPKAEAPADPEAPVVEALPEDPILLVDISSLDGEQAILVKAISSTIVPKLVSEDIPLFGTLMTAVFPTSKLSAPYDPKLVSEIRKVAKDNNYEDEQQWIDKMMQLNEILSICHGVIMVGPSGTGKSSCWRTLRDATEKAYQKKIVPYIIDPKAMTKEELYGVLDSTTLEWTDGVFTHIIRKIIDNVRGEQAKDHWIIFDGDVDPEWAENLNSVLDDNKLLTLPNGERLALTQNMRIMFEVKDLNHATLATVSRCGMVWFSERVVSTTMQLSNTLKKLRTENIEQISATMLNRWKKTQEQCCDALQKYFVADEKGDETKFILSVIEYCSKREHVMAFTVTRALMSVSALLKQCIARIVEYNDNHVDFPMTQEKINNIMGKYLAYALLWGMCGDMNLAERIKAGHEFRSFTSLTLPGASTDPLIDWEPVIETGEWRLWADRVITVELDANKVTKPDQVIETVDTTRHTDVLSGWLGDHRPLILCGPPGSGKSMTLTAVLNAMPEFELVTLNFSSSTGIDLILRTLKHHCTTEKTPTGLVMRPQVRNKWLVIFCDEINLPRNDKYQTQRVITFLRQITERGGFWRASDLSFVTLERVQIIGACNPPTDAGRVVLSPRFLRHCPLMFVDFPSLPSLKQIYGTFNRALLKLQPPLKGHWDALTDAMIDVYASSQARFTPDVQPHYIYSPRELSRWVRAMYEAMNPETAGVGISLNLDEMVRLWLHEALRLFSDRLVEASEREWTDRKVNEVARKRFPSANHETALARPVLFSNWLTKQYISVDQEALRDHVKLRLKVFREEELDIKLVIFDEVLEHILRIDRVLQQTLGHLLLVGASGGGKTVLSKFVSWMKGMSVFQIKVHKHYKAEDFDRDLRSVLTRSGCHQEKVCFIFDESNVLDSAFLERMNALLASGEVPGLFEGPDWQALMEECKIAANRDNLTLTTENELYKRFCTEVQRNLHVVFTMNPSNEDFDNRSATSPALFNRCVIDWFGEWSSVALYQVGHEFTMRLQLSDAPPGTDAPAVKAPEKGYESGDEDAPKKPMQMGSGTERDNVVSTLVYIHESVYKAMIMLARNTNRRTYVTPRHYLDFIKQYSQLSSEKRAELEESQRHLNTGLRKLKETQQEVATLRQSLHQKDIELKAKEKSANEKLEQIMIDTREAESKRDASEQIAAEIKVQAVGIDQRKSQVEAALANAKPALDEAKQAVSGIKKEDLDQVRRYPNPPAPVKLALEPVVLMLGEKKVPDWAGIRSVVARNNFLASIIDYDIDLLSEPVRKKIQETYLSDSNFTFDVVNTASKACGPLVKWVDSTISFARIKNSVQPMIDEMKALQEKSQEMQNKMDELSKIRKELADRIDGFKREYQALVGEAQAIKNEMETVKVKVARSESLLANLGVEQKRWELDSLNYEKEINTIVGDCLISAAFLAYVGYFNQSYREMLFQKWLQRLKALNVRHKSDLSLVEYLSHPTERLEWRLHGLPPDNLCIENAIMMKKFNRYPLIIDPSGQATSFLLKQYKERKIIRTSFMDDGFLKNLETSLRFGNALLVEDVEAIDPILNSVLNKEIFRQGGRVMITLGDKEIDFSPSFIIFLATRDASCHFTPDLCSRVTFVNFTVTHSSLTTQCLSKVLRAERKDIDDKRTDLMKLQGEFRVKLRQLEDQLLNSLSGVKGNILDDDKVMSDLEFLKSQAADVQKKMEESGQVLEEVEGVCNEYRPFAVVCSSIYFTLESLGNVHFLYQFSLPFFMGMVDKILFENPSEELKTLGKDPKKRFVQLSKELFQISYQRVARGLLNRDQLAFAVRLAQIALEELGGIAFPGIPLNFEELELFLKGRSRSTKAPGNYVDKLGLTNPQKLLLSSLLSLPAFEKLDGHLAANTAKWKEWIDNLEQDIADKGENPDLTPTGWEKSEHKTTKYFNQLLVTRVLRPDKIPSAVRVFVLSVFGNTFLDSSASVDLGKVVAQESSADEPCLLVSLPGYDASSKVDALAANSKMADKYEAFAMGSPEGYQLADTAINLASKEGRWVLLKNVHLSPQWLGNLEKRLHRMTHHQNFRLFMTMEVNPKVPANLLLMSNVLIFEPPVGLKSALLRCFSSMPEARVNKAPVERARLYFLLAWLHSVVLERLRYAPVGWTKGFEFGENDLVCAMDALDEWVDRTAQGKSNIAPEKIPWDALQALFEKILYGGRVDNEFDQARLVAFVKSLWLPKAYDVDFALSSTFNEGEKKFKPLVKMPEARDYAGFKSFVDAMPQFQSPELLGLPSNADVMLLTRLGENISISLQAMQDSDTGEDVKGDEAGVTASDDANTREKKKKEKRLSFSLSGEVKADRPQWMVSLEQSTARWLSAAPKDGTLVPLPTGKKLEELVLNPLFRCVQREYNVFRSILAHVLSDLNLVKDVLAGKVDANNRVRALFLTLKKDGLPEHWVKYGGSLKKDPTSLWIPDFTKRVAQFAALGSTPAEKYGDVPVWLGGFIAPEAFVAATRQAVAQAHNWSLEELVLKVTVDDKAAKPDSYTFVGLELFGAGWENGGLSINNRSLSFKMPPIRFTWVRKEVASKDTASYVRTPVYLDYTREKFLFAVDLQRPPTIPVELWSQRGTCLVVWGHSA